MDSNLGMLHAVVVDMKPKVLCYVTNWIIFISYSYFYIRLLFQEKAVHTICIYNTPSQSKNTLLFCGNGVTEVRESGTVDP